MKFSSTDEKFDRYLDDLAEEYKELLFMAFLHKSSSLESLSIEKLIELDADIKKPLKGMQSNQQKRTLIFGVMAAIYAVFFVIMAYVSTNYKLDNAYIVVLLFSSFSLLLVTIVNQQLKRYYDRKVPRKGDNQKYIQYEVINRWREVEAFASDLFMTNKSMGTTTALRLLIDNHYIEKEDETILRRLLKARNSILHSSHVDNTQDELVQILKDSEVVLNKVKKNN